MPKLLPDSSSVGPKHSEIFSFFGGGGGGGREEGGREVFNPVKVHPAAK